MAIADLSITYEREKAVDFSNPFMTLGISILYRKPRKQEPALFAFMSPLDFEVWIYMVFAYFIVSLLLFILARWWVEGFLLVLWTILELKYQNYIFHYFAPGSVHTSGIIPIRAMSKRSWLMSSLSVTRSGSQSALWCSKAVTSPPSPCPPGWLPPCGGSSPWSWSAPTQPTWPPSSPCPGWSRLLRQLRIWPSRQKSNTVAWSQDLPELSSE